MKKVMLTAALTGAGDTTSKSEYVPVTPEEVQILQSNVRAGRQLLTYMHVIQKQVVSVMMSIYLKSYWLIRRDEDIVINVTSGGGGTLSLI